MTLDASVPVRAAGPIPGNEVEVRETHTGIVILAGDRAYKSKKPVVTDFLDFSTRASREHACAREIELNRRLAKESYLGLAHFVGPDGGPGEPVIEMRRYPDRERLSEIVCAGLPAGGHLDAIAQQVAHLHAASAHSKEIDAAGRRTAIVVRWEENLVELGRRAVTLDAVRSINEIGRLFRRYVDGRAKLFAQRIDQKRIVDGHGDLQAGDIFCTDDGPVILDCLEFDDQLRYVDGLDDAAFLAMDLQFLGAHEMADRFLASYRLAADDGAPPSLAHFYCAYRAVVRAKVDCIRMEQNQTSARSNALRHLDLAITSLRAATVRLILVGGGPGTGKTTLSRLLGNRLSAELISTDDVRAELLYAGRLDGPAGRYGAGRYSPGQVETVYKEMLSRAGALLAQGYSVVLDGTWRDLHARECARALGSQYSCPVSELQCTATVPIAQRRIVNRCNSTSEVTPELAVRMAQDSADWPEAVSIDTTLTPEESVDRAVAVCSAVL
ncbi:AAA family ATPase [Mycobacterium sp. OTB74]|jgi:aminoglycoside phosphotransferase family enzyme/predicted kinase|uniref:bifunctional aminoglycoside phosphotransferase/ATP-binding protein n=1 Tax=Mycobacterium sp. OTB74 TaxID=1853452 RepID=UPI002476F76A|nr:AAA family ATPase [Mycobacterium sp. OTB74]MDH6246975.1 aminoglycoside phosphotransferase family enzyme/predicted kinase [Mycobacterium sp. OTB74]